MTLPALQLLAAKALPELIRNETFNTQSVTERNTVCSTEERFFWIGTANEVTSREWLWVCQELEKSLKEGERVILIKELFRIIAGTATKYYIETVETPWITAFIVANATAAQRLEAWARTKGIYENA